MKVIKYTDMTCTLCGPSHPLSLVQLSNGDKVLACLHCNEEIWGIIHDKYGPIVTVIPFEKIHFSSQEEALNKCNKVINELIY